MFLFVFRVIFSLKNHYFETPSFCHLGTNHLIFVGRGGAKWEKNSFTISKKINYFFRPRNFFPLGIWWKIDLYLSVNYTENNCSSGVNIEKKFPPVVKFKTMCHPLYFLHPSPQKLNGSSHKRPT